MNKSLLSLIKEMYGDFSKGQRLIADYVLSHYEKAAFMTASKLGDTVGVSESTVVRFAMELGFSGYPQFQRKIQEMIRRKLTSVQRMEVTSDRIKNNDFIESVLTRDIHMIRNTLEKTSRDSFKNAVEAINNARKIYIIGLRSSSALAYFLSFYFNLIFDNVVLIDATSASEIFEQMFRITNNDVLIAISFPRYSKQTVVSMRFANDRGAEIIAITDSDNSPIAPLASYLLLASSDMASFVDSLVAPLSLINALIIATSQNKKSEVFNTFLMLERVWDEYQVYENVEERQSDGGV